PRRLPEGDLVQRRAAADGLIVADDLLDALRGNAVLAAPQHVGEKGSDLLGAIGTAEGDQQHRVHISEGLRPSPPASKARRGPHSPLASLGRALGARGEWSCVASALRGGELVYGVDQGSYVIDGGLGQDAVAQVEDVARASGGLAEDGGGAGSDLGHGGEEGGGVEVPLHRDLVPEAVPGDVEVDAPVDADHVSTA